MQNVKVNLGFSRIHINKLGLVAIALVILVAAGLVLSNMRKPPLSTSPPALTTITESTLEAQYGLRVLLVAVTGAGGFVDVRMKIVDGEKAKLLLEDKENFPTVMADNDGVLNAPEDTKSQKIEFVTDTTMFIIYPNAANAVQSGEQVNLVFGDIVLEPIDVK